MDKNEKKVVKVTELIIYAMAVIFCLSAYLNS